jgi:hypothetical protein
MPSFVGLLIHVPQLTDTYRYNVFTQIRLLLDAIEDGLSPVEEQWYVTSEASKMMLTWDYLAEATEQWYNHVSEMQKSCCFLAGNVAFFAGAKTAKRVTFSATIKPLPCVEFPLPWMLKNERQVNMEIPKETWDGMDQMTFLDTLKAACCTLGASYACIDHELIIAKDIDSAGFRLYGEHADEIDPESRLPGVYWGQFVSPRMIERTGSIAQIVMEAPCKVREIINLFGVEGLWLQLTAGIWQTPKENRISFRQYFADSLYVPSLRVIAGHSISEFLTRIVMLPLTDDEIEEINRLRDPFQFRL